MPVWGVGDIPFGVRVKTHYLQKYIQNVVNFHKTMTFLIP